MKKIYSLLLLLFFVFTGQQKLLAQVDVTATAGTLTASYTTLKAAFDAINLGTHKGDIIIDISANTTETAPAVLNSGDADPASYTSILIEPVADGVSVSGAPGAGRGVIELNGADNVLIIGDNPNTGGSNRNLTIANTSGAAVTASSVIRIATKAGSVTSADNNFILNCILNGNVTSGNASGTTLTTSSSNVSFGIYCGGNAGATSTTAPTVITSATADAAASGTTINNLVIDNNQINQCGRAIVFNGAATNVSSSLTITNNTIGATAVLGTFPYTTPVTTVYSKGIWIAGTESVSISTNTVQNIISYLSSTIAGIELATNIGTSLIDISGNTVTGIVNNNTAAATNDAFGVLVSSAANKFTVSGNTITTVQNGAGTPVAGVKIATGGGGAATINQNTISGIFSKNTGGWGAFGIYLATAANGAEINNNFIYDIMNVGAASFAPIDNASGIFIASGSNHKIYHNSVHLSGVSAAASTNAITCLSVLSSASTGLDIRNNIFSNVVSGGSASDAHVCMYFPFAATASLGYTINNNAYYTGTIAGKSGIAYAGSNSYLATNVYDVSNFNALSTAPATNFRSYSSAAGVGANDFASFGSTAAAPFTSATNLHIPAATVTRLESGAVPVGIAVDIDNAARSGTSPDIGADEFAGTPQDLTPPLISYIPLAGTCTLGNRTLSVKITDASGVGTGANLPRLWWKINAGAYVLAAAPTVAGNNYTFTFGAGAVVGDIVSYYVVAQDNAGTPNVISQSSVGAGPFTSNPPAATTAPPLPDTYTVQNNLPLGTYTVGVGQTYTTLTAAVAAYNTSCLNGAVIFNLTDATYPSETYPITIGNPVASAINTLTIKPAPGVNATITGASATALIKLNGADYITIDGSNSGGTSQNLTINNTDPGTNSAVIWVASESATNGSTNNTIKNCLIAGSGGAATFFGVVSSSGTTINAIAEAANTNNTYQNNNITSASYGIALIGPAAGETNNSIIGNKVGSANVAEKLGYRGIYIANQTGVSVTSNNVLGIASTASGTITRTEPPAGIIVKGAISNGIINLNKVSDCKNTSTGGWPVHGITLASTTVNSGLSVYNNFVYDVWSFGWPSIASDNGHGIGVILGGGYNIYYNSINLTTNQTNPSGTISAAIYIGSSPAQLNIKNNIFSNQQTINVRYSIYTEGDATAFTSINHNDYYTTGSNLGSLTSTRTNIGAWQTATGQDGNSISIDPVFISSTDLHLGPASPLNAVATPIGTVLTDIDGNGRNATTPDIGADEFTPPNCSGPITGGTITSTSTNLCVSGNIVLASTGYSIGNGMTYQWEYFNGASWVAVAGENNPTSANIIGLAVTTQYRLSAACSFGGSGVSGNTITVTVNSPSITASAGASRCGVGTVSLSATGSAGTQVNWYDDPTGGTPLATNTTTFTTPTISTTTVFYAQALTTPTLGSVGPTSPSTHGGTINLADFTRRLIFNVNENTSLVSVDIFPQTAGETFNLQLVNSSGTVLQTYNGTTSVSGGITPQTLTLNWPLTIGNGYYLTSPTMPLSGLYRNTSGSTFPYTSPSIDITGSDLLPYYTYYYNWQYSTSCGSSPRTSVTATITAPPALTTLSVSPASICAGASVTLNAAGAGYTSYVWTPGSLSGGTQTVSPTTTTTYTVLASNVTCATTGQVTVTVNPVPTAITITPASPTVCAGSTQSLVATGGNGAFFSEMFETFPISKFTVVNTAPPAIITESQNTTYYQQGVSSVRLSYDVDTDLDPASYETSSDINLSLYNNPVLNFAHICAMEHIGTSNYDFGYVEYSTDGGATWTTFPAGNYTGAGTLLGAGGVGFSTNSYPDWTAQFTSGTSTPGVGPATALWKSETIDLSTWQTSTQFRFRFRISSDFSVNYYGWLLDNIRITGQAAITWSPATELFTDAGALTPYVLNTNYATVYTKPTATRTYTATSSVGGCSSTANVTPTVTANPISLTIAANPGTTICGADTVKFTITAQNVQGSTNVVYDWKVNGVTLTGSATGASSAGTTVTVASTANLYVGMKVTVSAGTGAFQVDTRITSILNATQFTISVAPILALSGATIAATASGKTVTSVDIWSLANGDVVTCVLTVGGVTCVVPFTGSITSNAVGPFTVNANTPASVTISPSPTTIICAGVPTTFTATPVNGGAAPTYEWFVNGISQGAPASSNSFTTSTLTNGQVVTCRMASNATNCPLPLKPISSGTTVTVNPSFPVSVTISANPGVNICNGTSVTFTAVPANGGVTPSYQWYVGATPVGTNSSTYTTNTLADLDVVTCVLTSSIASCAIGNPATSNPLNISVTTQTASVAISPTAAVCAGGGPVLYTATGTNGGATPTYEWFVNNISQGPATVGATTFSYTPADGDSIRVDMVTSLSCASPVPATTRFKQVVNAVPTANITGSNTLCTGIPVLLNSNAVAGSGAISTIQWKLGGVNIGGATAATYIANSVGNYTVVVTNTNTCSVTSGTFTITAAPTLMSGVYTIGAITATGASSAGTTITVASTANLVVGALLTKVSGAGTLAPNTIITSIINGTTFTVSAAPTVALSAASLAGSTCTNYISFATAIADLNSRSMNGNCTFNVTPGYVENIAAQLSLGAPVLNIASNTWSITFQKNGVGANPLINAAYAGTTTGAGAVADGIWSLNGINNVTVDGVDMNDNNSANATVCMEYGYGLFKSLVTATGGSSAGTTITVASTAGLVAGGTVAVTAGTGVFVAGTTISSITNATTFVVSTAPSTALSGATVTMIDGAQSNTIKNATVTLNRVNVSAGAGPMQAGSTGIAVMNAIRSNSNTNLTAGGTYGANSNNKLYSNTIQNCNNGIALSGFADASPFTNADFNNDIGGGAAGTGNTIVNFGGGAGATLAAMGVIANNQWSVNISYNTINNNNGSGVNHVSILRGIYGQAGTSAGATINNNIISVNGAGTTQAVTGIENSIGITAAANTVSINNNTITGSYTTATTGTWLGINNTANPATLNMNFNTVQNVTLPGNGSNTFTGITSTGAFASGSTLRINNNTITNNTKTNVATGAAVLNNMSLIVVTGPVAGAIVEAKTNTISGNTITGGNHTPTLLGISMGGAGTVTASDNIISANSITSMSLTPIATIQGYSNGSTSPNETVTNNTINNLFITGSGTGLHVINGIRNNTVGAAVRTISNNTISNLYTASGLSAVITGIVSSTGATIGISKNKIYNLFPGQSATPGSIAKGISITTGTTVNVSNNMISLDLTLAAASTSSVAANSVLTGADAVRGIEITSALAASTLNVYYNSIRLAGNGGAGFGSTALFHTTNATATTAALNLRNNIIDNECTPNGGLTVAYRRSTTVLANYAATSNNNLFYAGTPSASRLIFNDGTNSDQTLAAYKTRVSARDAASVSDLPNFVSTTDLHLTLDNNCIINGQGAPIGGFTDDYDAVNSRDASTPDIGFDEFAGTNPVSLTVTNPAAVCTGSTIDLTAGTVTTGSSGGTVFYYYTDAGGTTTLATPAAVAGPTATYYIKYGKGSCYSAVTPVVATFTPSGTWLGVDNVWNNAANWCGGIPTSATNVTIPTAPNYPTISGITAAANNITITGSGTITVASTGKLQIAGSITSTANAIDGTAGTIEFIGTSAQTLRANYFNTASIANLIVSNTSVGGLSIDNTGSMLNITTEVNFGNANNQKFNTNNLLTLKSTATATARVADVTLNSTRTGNDVIGKVVIERFIPARRSWRLVSAPIKSSTIPTPTIYNNWQESARSYPIGTLANPVPGYGTHVSFGNNVGNFDQNNTNNSSIFYLTAGGWNGVPTNTSGTSIGSNNGVITDQPGYMLFVRGDRSTNLALGTYAPTSVTTLRTTGDINVTSNAASPLVLNGTGAYVSGPAKYYTFANPYPSAISFEKLFGEVLNAGIPNVFYVWDANLTGSNGVGGWVTVTRTGPSTFTTSPNTPSMATGEIQSGQAFLLNYPSGGATVPLTYKEAFKVSGSNVSLYRPMNNQIRTTLNAHNADGSTSVNDGTLISFDPSHSNELDRDDANKMPNFAENISIVKDGIDLSIEKRRSIAEDDTVFFKMSKMKTKSYSLSFDLDGLTGVEGKTAILEDLFLKTKTALNMEGSTNYDFSVVVNTPSADAARFRIVFKKLVQYTKVDAHVVNDDVAVDWNVSSEFNIHHYEIERSANGTSFETVGNQLSSGDSEAGKNYSLLDLHPAPGVYYYRIKCIGNNGAVAYSDKAKVTIIKGSPEMFVFPNPVTNNIIGLQMNKMAGGVYETILMSEDGKIINRNRIVHAEGTSTESIVPKSSLVSGAYKLQIVAPGNKITILKVIVQTK